MQFSPRPYQQVAIDRMRDHEVHYLALRMGLGKSVIALTAVQDMLRKDGAGPALVVAPNGSQSSSGPRKRPSGTTWQGCGCSGPWGPPSNGLRAAQAGRRARDHRECFPWLVRMITETRRPWPWPIVLLDENVGFRDRSSKAWQAVKQVRHRIERLYMLSGTPTPNGLLDLWAQISILDKGARLGTGITRYRERWFEPDRRNGHVVYSWRPKPGAQAEIEAAVADIMLSLEGQADLPERIDNIVPVTFDRTRYRELEQTMVSGALMASSAGVLADNVLDPLPCALERAGTIE